MTRFRGRYDYTVDGKGRLNIPAKWRKQLSPDAEDTFVVCRAPGGCLWAYPQDEWEKFEEKMESMPAGRDSDRIQRMIHSTLTDSVLDKQGRITLSPHQMQMAGIGKNICLIGRRSYVEVWDAERFEQYVGDGGDFDEIYYSAVSQM
ncbi:MAG: division/cell wall cluster transcriptional repressor MraZ [Chitinivibrionales bacterium]|nr:division/cell wall cluster transcriptional repressor MraZ [Chitinivibrionales bacterium]